MDDIIGEECGDCHEEAFRLVPREITHTHKIKVCLRCAYRLDTKAAEDKALLSADGMSKAERRLFFQEQSFEWARKLHGKKVVVRWHHRDKWGSPNGEYSEARGTAFRTGDECGGWGRVNVIIDPSEHYRVCLQWTYSIGEGGKHCPYQKPLIDGEEYGLYLNLEPNGSYSTLVSWGHKNAIALDEKIIPTEVRR